MNDRAVRDAWQANAAAWIRTVRAGALGSRERVTNRAIVAAVCALAPRRVVDIGCGEGWLCRALAAHDIGTVGLDGTATLVRQAAADDTAGDYRCIDYDDLADLDLDADVAVFNFALLAADLATALDGAQALLAPTGALVIQTLHPWSSHAGHYRDGWREERFEGLGTAFAQPMPWYFRTLESWFSVLGHHGWRIEHLQEPRDPLGDLPASIIFTCRRAPARGG